MRLDYHDSALNDIEAILDYIEPLNPQAAIRLGEGLLDTCALLEQNSELGARCEELGTVWVLPYRGYGIYYDIDYGHHLINVSRILHPRIDIGPEMFGVRK